MCPLFCQNVTFGLSICGFQFVTVLNLVCQSVVLICPNVKCGLSICGLQFVTRLNLVYQSVIFILSQYYSWQVNMWFLFCRKLFFSSVTACHLVFLPHHIMFIIMWQLVRHNVTLISSQKQTIAENLKVAEEVFNFVLVDEGFHTVTS